jgi:hypothetical protein
MLNRVCFIGELYDVMCYMALVQDIYLFYEEMEHWMIGALLLFPRDTLRRAFSGWLVG